MKHDLSLSSLLYTRTPNSLSPYSFQKLYLQIVIFITKSQKPKFIVRIVLTQSYASILYSSLQPWINVMFGFNKGIPCYADQFSNTKILSSFLLNLTKLYSKWYLHVTSIKSLFCIFYIVTAHFRLHDFKNLSYNR